MIETHHPLLKRCREIGIAAVFEMAGQDPGSCNSIHWVSYRYFQVSDLLIQ